MCTEILYGSLLTVGLVPSTAVAPAVADDGDKAAAAADEDAVFRRHPGFTADSIGYNAETGQLVALTISYHMSPD